jgi:hypothetical protein
MAVLRISSQKDIRHTRKTDLKSRLETQRAQLSPNEQPPKRCVAVIAGLTILWTVLIGVVATDRLLNRERYYVFLVEPPVQSPTVGEGGSSVTHIQSSVLTEPPLQSQTVDIVGSNQSSVLADPTLYSQTVGEHGSNVTLIQSTVKVPPHHALAPTNSRVETEQNPRHTHVFYNIFMPDDRSTGGNGTNRANNIVSEQLLQIAQSYVGGYYNNGAHTGNATTLPSVTIHYTTIGPSDLLTETEMNDPSKFCGIYPNIHCRHLGHFTEGSEAYTLEQLRQHCVGHPSERVVYLHSKGSYHPHELNEGWRKALTFGATTKECVDPPDDKCNVCGVLFYTMFTTFVPGNMFAAKCDYVSKLLSPLDEFPAKQREVVGEALLLIARRQLTSNLLNDQVDFFGLDRYTAEHWIGTS